MTTTRMHGARALSPVPSRARRELRSMLHAVQWPGDIESVVLAVDEALMNASQHGGGSTGATAGFDGPEVVVEISDRGPGFDPDAFTRRHPDTLAERGRGLWLISRIATSFGVERTGGTTRLRLCFRP